MLLLIIYVLLNKNYINKDKSKVKSLIYDKKIIHASYRRV